MKKIYIYLLILLCASTSCENLSNPNNVIRIQKTGIIRAFEYEYNKHSYILFKKSNQISVVHNPDCSYCYSIMSDSVNYE